MDDWENLKCCQEILLFVLATHNNRPLTSLFFLRYLLKTAYSCEHVSVSLTIQKFFSQGPECYSFEMFFGFVMFFVFCVFFWLHHLACEILFPWPGIKPIPLAVKAWSPNHWTGREFPLWNVIIRKHRASMTIFVTGWNPNFGNCQLTNRWPKCIYTDQLHWAGASGRSLAEGNGNPFQYSCLKNPWTEKPGGPPPLGSQRITQDWETNTFTFTLLSTPPHTP